MNYLRKSVLSGIISLVFMLILISLIGFFEPIKSIEKTVWILVSCAGFFYVLQIIFLYLYEKQKEREQ